MSAINFQATSTFDEYCKSIEDFIAKDTKVKCSLGFLMHDSNEDNRICPIDMGFNISTFGTDCGYLHWFDLTFLGDTLQSQISSIKKKEPGYFLKEFEDEFEEIWQAKKTGIKRKRPRFGLNEEDEKAEVIKVQNEDVGGALFDKVKSEQASTV